MSHLPRIIRVVKLGFVVVIVAALLGQLVAEPYVGHAATLAPAAPDAPAVALPSNALALTASASRVRRHRPPTTTSIPPTPTTLPVTTTTKPPVTTTTSVTTPPQPVAGPPIGLSFGDTLPGLSRAALDQELDDAASLGVGWIRLDLAWDDIQPVSPSAYQWSAFDQIVSDATARRLTLLPILSYTPQWARPPTCGTDKCAPANPTAFATFAAAAVRRYAPLGVHTWEIWNEPNNSIFWLPAPNPAGYVTLLRSTAAAMRAVDPAATLISGGLAPMATSGGDIAQLDFLTAFCQLGGQQLVDAIGYHPYSFPVPPGYPADWNAWQQISATATSFRSILAAHGASGKKIWLTEYGAPTNGPGAGATSTDYRFSANPDHVDEPLQAIMATDSVNLARTTPVIGALFWYSYRDIGTASTDTENFYGLKRFNGSAKPAWAAFRNAIAAAG